MTKGQEGRGTGESVTPNRWKAATSYATARYNPGEGITSWQYLIRKHDPIDLKKDNGKKKRKQRNIAMSLCSLKDEIFLSCGAIKYNGSSS